MKRDDPASPSPPCILVVDDHPAVRAGLSILVESRGLKVCAEAAGSNEALTRADRRQPDVAIVDLSLDGEDGLSLVENLNDRGVHVLVYSMHSDAEHIMSALGAGALGYVTKSEVRDVLIDGILQVSTGNRFVSPRAAIALADRATGSHQDDEIRSLSSKEAEVFRRLGKGDGTLEIAAGMGISTHTVESYYSRIKLKLNIHGMYELRHRAIQFLQQHHD